MRARWLVNFVLLAVVAALVAYVLHDRRGDDPSHEPITSLAASVVQHIAVERDGTVAIELVREGDTWFVSSPLRARANATQVDRILDLLAVRGRDRMPAQELQRFDLDRPALRVRFDDTAIAFGTFNPLTQDQYALVGDAVFMIPGHHRAAVPDRVERVLTHALLRKNEKPVAFVLPDFAVERVDGKWIRRPEPAHGPLSQDDFNRWVDEWRFASSLLTQPTSGKRPGERIAVSFEDGRTVQFGIRQREPELVLARDDESLSFYFSRDTRERLLAGPASNAPVGSAGEPDASAKTER